MAHDDTNEEKQAVGSFAVSQEKEEVETVDILQDSLEERLKKVIPQVAQVEPSAEESNEEKTSDTSLTTTPIDQVSVENEESASSSPEVVTENESQVPLQPSETVSNEGGKSEEDHGVTTATTESGTTQPVEYHTISGGPETFIEMKKKSIETQPKEPIDSIGLLNMPKKEETLVKEVPQSLPYLIFKTLLLAEVLMVVLYYTSPTLLMMLSQNGHITLNADGSYTYGDLLIPRTITTLLLHGSIVLGVLGVLLIILGWIIDCIKETMHIALKVLVFCVLVGGIMWLIIFLKQTQIIDLVGMIKVGLSALGITLFPL